MNLTPVSSSNLSAVGYESGTLYVSFHNGGYYSYNNVPEYVFHELLNAPSKGVYFSENIKNSYTFTRLR